MKTRYKIVPSSYLVLIKDGTTLLARRCNTGFEDGNYGLVSGHGEEGETFTETLVREVFEEAGIKIRPEDVKVAHICHRKASQDERIDAFFVTEKWAGEPKIMEPEKCDSIKWFEMDNLPENTIDYIKKALQNINAGIFYSEYGWSI